LDNQANSDLISLKISLNETIDHLYQLENKILDVQYELLALINHNKSSSLNFGLFFKKTNSILKQEITALEKEKDNSTALKI
tara:strand:- start:301 stop:546 length:246 start_codon:yes stop_codon:yes gene_type:complete